MRWVRQARRPPWCSAIPAAIASPWPRRPAASAAAALTRRPDPGSPGPASWTSTRTRPATRTRADGTTAPVLRRVAHQVPAGLGEPQRVGEERTPERAAAQRRVSRAGAAATRRKAGGELADRSSQAPRRSSERPPTHGQPRHAGAQAVGERASRRARARWRVASDGAAARSSSARAGAPQLELDRRDPGRLAGKAVQPELDGAQRPAQLVAGARDEHSRRRVRRCRAASAAVAASVSDAISTRPLIPVRFGLDRAVDEPVADAPHVHDEAVAAARELLAQPAGVRVQASASRPSGLKPQTSRNSSSLVKTRVGADASARAARTPSRRAPRRRPRSVARAPRGRPRARRRAARPRWRRSRGAAAPPRSAAAAPRRRRAWGRSRRRRARTRARGRARRPAREDHERQRRDPAASRRRRPPAPAGSGRAPSRRAARGR